MFNDIDVVVYDLQDVGTRFYTYISTMGLVMQTAAAAGVDVVILDRPNPQRSRSAAGYVRADGYESFVSQYPVPAAYGLTAGELAQMIVGERWLPGLEGIDLRVVPMRSWSHGDGWPDGAGAWVPPSPGLPSLTSALVYPGTVLFEATPLSVGRGTDATFAIVGAPWVDDAALAARLNRSALPGVAFEPITFVPVASGPTAPRFLGESVSGVRFLITEPGQFEPVGAAIHVFVALRDQAASAGLGALIDRPEMLDLLAGTGMLREMLDAGASAEMIVDSWAQEVDDFSRLTQPYLLYG